jgi:hypothetical protein
MSISDESWTAVALLYGPPLTYPSYPHVWVEDGGVPTALITAFEKVFHPEEIKRVGLRRMVCDYAEWYQRNEHYPRQSPQDDGVLPRT